MNAKQRQTLQRVFAEPTPGGLKWSEIESLLIAVDAEISEGAGSRVRVALNGVRAVFHRPHPSPDTRKSAVRGVRDFLKAAGVIPSRS